MALLVVAGATAAVYFTLAPRWPKDNVVHIVLGGAAPRVEEVRVGYAPAAKRGAMAEDWTREAAFRFPGGDAPRVVTHEPRLADGDYVVEIEIVSRSPSTLDDAGARSASPPRAAPHNTVLERHVTFQGGTTSLDVSDAIDR